MKNYYLIVVLFVMGYNTNAQVGINTSNPKSTLHVQKKADLTYADGIIPPRTSRDSLRQKNSAYGAAQNGAIVYVTDVTTGTTDSKTANISSTGLYIFDSTAFSNVGAWSKLAQGPGDGAYSAKFNGSLSAIGLTVGGGILNLNIGGSTANTTTTVEVPSTSMSNGVYTVPSSGIYHITYNYKEGSGASVSLLTNSGIVINRTPVGSSTATALDSRGFGGVSVVLVLTVSITQTTISHIYNLTAGDKIQFGINRQSLLSADLLTAIQADVSIYKIQ
ncbi:hypothetical protein [Chryseobacterium turcicum]|uniref:C1q domain-containing protein n=1 Tax=Chryseobacterium turcicum TaxID=2898076 RepID=A0A9Q3YWJ2_9FLAO|nr:hypothetical protein [Chryseobacterium turcicum]MCD1116037.1 hypothetical protein [Chryseobacterium turcicum]